MLEGECWKHRERVCFSWAFIPEGHHYRAQVGTTLPVSSL